MIEVRNLVKKYGQHVAVDHLNFTIEKGKIYGFLGPNGAGKSTTMNMLTGYLASTEGDIFVDGIDILEKPEEAKKKIGFLPEIPPLYPDMTVQEYLCFAAELKKIEKKEIKEQVQNVMDKVQIDHVKNRLIKNLSKGYKQRVGLAQAVLGDPEVLILDEPTVGLDPKQIIEIRDMIRELGKKHTVILSSHILSEISAVADEIMIISHGKLVASDTPENLKRLMEKTNSLRMIIKGDKKDIVAAVKTLSGIDKVEYTETEEENCIQVSIETRENIDIREEIFYRLANAKCPILEMQSKTVSLEDVFLELTSEESAENIGNMKTPEEETEGAEEGEEENGGDL